MNIVFTTLALNQTRYFVALAKSLHSRGVPCSIISFHEDSNDFIKSQRVNCFNVFEFVETNKLQEREVEAEFSLLMSQYQIDCPNILLSHEKTAFDISNENPLKLKFIKYFNAIEKIFDQLTISSQSPISVYQELGGFASLLATFYVARNRGFDHFFIEPSFFKGRMFFVKNSIYAQKIKNQATSISPPVKEYLRRVKANREIVIPKKDVAYYQHPVFKILSGHNIKRLFQKLFGKYFRSRKEEFNHIGSFVLRHLRMLANRIRFARFYSQLPEHKFIYYPFHVPMDVSLTIRSPLYLDQYSLIDYIARSIPANFKLVIKEHPAMIGVVKHWRIKDLLSRNPNVTLAHPDINNYDILKKADLIITVNSKTGAESLLFEKKVICLGDAFYNQSNLVSFFPKLSDLGQEINFQLRNPKPSADSISQFFQNTWNASFPGELYYCSEENIKASSDSLVQSMSVSC